MELEDYIRQMDTMMENYTTGTSTYPLTSNEVILTRDVSNYTTLTQDMLTNLMDSMTISTTFEPNWVMYTGTQGYRQFQNHMSITRRSYSVTGGSWGGSISQIPYKNYTVSENLTKNKNQREFVITTRSGRKISKIVNKNMIEKERADLYKGRVIGYKEYWENV